MVLNTMLKMPILLRSLLDAQNYYTVRVIDLDGDDCGGLWSIPFTVAVVLLTLAPSISRPAESMSLRTATSMTQDKLKDDYAVIVSGTNIA